MTSLDEKSLKAKGITGAESLGKPNERAIMHGNLETWPTRNFPPAMDIKPALVFCFSLYILRPQIFVCVASGMGVSESWISRAWKSRDSKKKKEKVGAGVWHL